MLKFHVYGLDVAGRGARVVLGTGFIDVRRLDFRGARLEDLVEICGSVAPEVGVECVRRSTMPVVPLVQVGAGVELFWVPDPPYRYR